MTIFHEVTGNVRTLAGVPTSKRARVMVISSVPKPGIIVDTDGDQLLVGDMEVQVDAATGDFTIPGLIDYNDVDTQPFHVKYMVFISYPVVSVQGTTTTAVWDSGWLMITEDADLADPSLLPGQYSPPEWQSGFMAQANALLSSKVAEAEAIRQYVNDVSNIALPDSVITAIDSNPASAFRQQQDARLSTSFERYQPPVYFLNAYENFFGGDPTMTFVPSQRTTTTTLTAGVSPGATVLPVASATGLLPGTVLILGNGSATQQLVKVVSVASLDVTVTPAVATARANGASVVPLWGDYQHPTTAAYDSYAYFIANAKKADGSFVIEDPGADPIVFLGNSWFELGGSAYATQVHARLPSATVINAGVSGNGSLSLLTRFADDVPSNARYVIINEPAINDMTALALPVEGMAANLDELIRMTRAIGAIPVIVGTVPYLGYSARAAMVNDTMAAQLSGGAPNYPALSVSAMLDLLLRPTGLYSTRFGVQTQQVATGEQNTAFGYSVQKALTTGTNNTALGAAVQVFLTTGSENTAFGSNAQRGITTSQRNTALGALAQNVLTTGSNNTAVGAHVQAALTTGGSNTGLGYNAQEVMTTGEGNVGVGMYSQQVITIGEANTAIGFSAQKTDGTTATKADLYFGIAIGYNAQNTADNTAVIGGMKPGERVTLCLGNFGETGGGRGGISLSNNVTIPATNPVGGGILYADGGAGKWRGSSGTITTFGTAEPHCPDCGRDFALEWESDRYGYLALCMWCVSEQMTVGVMARREAA